jgi:hypothetical protein
MSMKKVSKNKKKNFDKVQHLENLDKGPTNFLALDLIETCHRVNSLCVEIVEKYGFSDEESIVEEDSHEMQHVKNSNETSTSSLSFDEDEVVQPRFSPAHEDEEVIGPDDANDFMEDLSEMVGQHIDDFIQVGRHRWDVGYFIFDRDPIYEI